MNAKTPKASTNDFDSLLGGGASNPAPEPVTKSKAVPKPKPVLEAVKSTRGRPAVKGNDVQTSFYYPSAWKKRLKEQAIHEDVSVNDLVLEGIRLMFEKRGINPDKGK